MSFTENKRRHIERVRHFGTAVGRNPQTGETAPVIIATHERGIGDFEILGSGPNGISIEEWERRTRSMIGEPFIEYIGNRALFIGDDRVSRDDFECVYNDCEMVNRSLGDGAYESVANEYELAVLELARRLYAETSLCGTR